ncbi:hypothetical protein BDZ89DRAFT_804589 [Hymenopellis radicata]|nr:hypothetical protein BDZ89DRAFT_804589 [Hymenopellis radicata]
MSSAICELPNEVLLAIVAHLDLAAVLALRQTCRIICEATGAKLVWLRFLEEQQASVPLYASIRDPASAHVLGLSAQVLRSTVLQNRRINGLWLERRATVPRLIRSPLNEHLIGVELLEDRWLLAVYGEGIHLWDLDADDVESSLLLQREGLSVILCHVRCRQRAHPYRGQEAFIY